MTFTQTLYGNEAARADSWCDNNCLQRVKESYDIGTDCRVPACQSTLAIVPGGLITAIILHQTITGETASMSWLRQNRLLNFYSEQTGCRVPLCQASMTYVAGSISMRVMLAIPDVPAGSTASSNASSITAAANVLAARPINALSAMMNETVVSTSPPVVNRVRRIDVRLVLSIPDSETNVTVAAVMAAVNTLASQPTAVASLLNATLISTSSVVLGHAVLPLIVGAPPPPLAAIRSTVRPTTVIGIVTPIVVVLIIAIAIAFACFRRSMLPVARQELLAEAKERQETNRSVPARHSRRRSSLPPIIETELTAGKDVWRAEQRKV